ncbi:hypothetical protein K440DRAFT_679776, partial [Wilcoxina mikolae CBS 423.85]
MAVYVLGASEEDLPFVNSLFSDLAPILALFGEDLVKQFMSESMGWCDHIMFGMAPIGIISAVVGAIRVSGPYWLKSAIGRGRESSAAVEIELLSSTSSEIREIWNGERVERTTSQATVQPILWLENTGGKFYTIVEAEREGLLQRKFSKNQRRRTGDAEGDSPTLSDLDGPRPDCFPNISLNINPLNKSWELYAAAAFGVIIQFSVLLFSGVTVYYAEWNLKFQKKGRPVPGYEYPLMAIGTILLVIGMMLCSAVIDLSTTEEEWAAMASNGKQGRFNIMWIQKGQIVNERFFDSYIIFARGSRDSILTSYRNIAEGRHSVAGNETEASTLLATLFSLVGFIFQLQGLQGLHWSASLSQVTAIFAMTAVRGWVRRRSKVPLVFKVLNGHEMDQLALTTFNEWGRDYIQQW